MKIKIIYRLLLASSLVISSPMIFAKKKVTCLKRPRINYSGDGGLGGFTNFEKRADEEFKNIKRDWNIVKKCPIYKELKSNFKKIYIKAKKYDKDADQGGYGGGKRDRRAKAARCLKAMHSKMIYTGKDHVGFVKTVLPAGTKMEYNMGNRFAFNQYCDDPRRDNTKGGTTGGSSSTTSPRGPKVGIPSGGPVRGPGGRPNTGKAVCPKASSLAAKKVKGWKSVKQKLKLLGSKKFGRKVRCFYSINGKGKYNLYSK